MLHILLIDENTDKIKKIKLKLLTHLKVTAVVKNSLTSATEIFNLMPNITLVAGSKEYNSPENIVSLLKVYADSKSKILKTFIYDKNDSEIEIMKTIASALGIESNSLDKISDEVFNYHPVKMSSIYNIETPCDLYIKVGKKDDNQQFIKRVNAYELVEEDLYKKLVSFNISEVYIHKDDYDIFYNSMTNKIVSNLADESFPVEKTIKFQLDAFKYLTNLPSQLDFDNHTIEITNSTIESVKQTIVKQKSLSDLINKIINQKESIQFQTFYLTNLISSSLLKKEKKMNEHNVKSFVFSSLFCDLSLSPGHMFYVNSQEELDQALDKKEITEDQYKIIQEHAKNNASTIKKFPDINLDVIEMIKKHHGSATGIGFDDVPKDLNFEEKLFMASNTFIKAFLNPIYKFNKKAIVERQILRFSRDPDLRRLSTHLSLKIE